MSCFLWSSSYSQITRWIAKKAGIFAHSLSVWLAKNRESVRRTKAGLRCDKTELKFPSIIIRVEKPGGNLLCRELLVWCRSGPDQRSFVTPVTLSISPQSLLWQHRWLPYSSQSINIEWRSFYCWPVTTRLAVQQLKHYQGKQNTDGPCHPYKWHSFRSSE